MGDSTTRELPVTAEDVRRLEVVDVITVCGVRFSREVAAVLAADYPRGRDGGWSDAAVSVIAGRFSACVRGEAWAEAASKPVDGHERCHVSKCECGSPEPCRTRQAILSDRVAARTARIAELENEQTSAPRVGEGM